MSINDRQRSDQLSEAYRLHFAGLVPIPVEPTGEKKPAVRWACYRDRKEFFRISLVNDWFRWEERGLAVLGGAPSGGLEQLDFDQHQTQGDEFKQWCAKVPGELLSRLVIYTSPGNGNKVCWKCHPCLKAPTPSEVLAYRRPEEASIEYIVNLPLCCPGGSPRGHPTGKPYQYVQNHLSDVPTIEAGERDALLAEARRLTLWTPPPKPERSVDHTGGSNLWSATGDFDRRATWEEILEPAGWEKVKDDGEVASWRRPGKAGGSASATTNYAGSNLFYCFSSSTAFVKCKGYSKWAAWAVLYCDGNFSAAAKKIASLGYGLANKPLSYYHDQLERIYGRLP